MDLTTLLVGASLLFGLIVGNAALSGDALYVTIAVPTQTEKSGLSQSTAEQLFIAGINQYLQLTPITPTPSVSTSAAPSLPMALAKPLQLQDVVYSIQAMLNDYGVVHVNGSVVADAQGPGVEMFMVVNNPPDPPVAIALAQPDGNTKALIEKAARETMVAIGPYRVAITDFEDGVSGDATGFDRSKEAINRGLAQAWDPRPNGATEDVLLFNLRGLLAMRDGNLAEAEKDFAQSRTIPGAYPEAYGLVSLNQAFLAIARQQPEEAARRYSQGAASVAAIPKTGIASRVKVLAGLVAWSGGDAAAAEQDFRAAIAMTDNDEMPHLYLADLLAGRGDTAGAEAERGAGKIAQRFDPKYPAMADTIFHLDPVHGGYRPMF